MFKVKDAVVKTARSVWKIIFEIEIPTEERNLKFHPSCTKEVRQGCHVANLCQVGYRTRSCCGEMRRLHPKPRKCDSNQTKKLIEDLIKETEALNK